MSVDDLYREIILDHYRSPRNKRRGVEGAIAVKHDNPLCGDELHLSVDIQNGELADVAFDGKGCSISQASASMMTDCLKGRTLEQVGQVADAFQKLVTEEHATLPEGDDLVEKLEAFAGVREFPSRVKCASLAWHALRAAIEQHGGPVSTE